MLLVPAIDVRGGRCVRLLRGSFAEETHYEVQPRELLVRYRSLGASWLHIVDLDGAKDGVLVNQPVIASLASQPGVHLQVGGGVRSAKSVEDCFQQGIARVVIGSAAVERPGEVAGWLKRFGTERICLAFDVRLDAAGVPRVRTRGWVDETRVSLWDAVTPFLPAGVRHILCTDTERDGALSGPNFALYREAVSRFPQLAWQASGGVRSAADLAELARTGVACAIAGKALLETRIQPEEWQPFLPDASSPVSMSATARS